MQKALADGVSETELIANADKMRENTWLRIQRNRKKMRTLKKGKAKEDPNFRTVDTKAKGTDATKVRGIG